jgi:hypothetical protein
MERAVLTISPVHSEH